MRRRLRGPETAARFLGVMLQAPYTDESIHQAVIRMIEGFWQRADDFKAMFLPEMHRYFIGRDDGIELHGLEAKCHRLLLQVVAHRRGNTVSPGVSRDDIVAAVTDMRSRSLLIRFEVIGPENALVSIFCDIGANRL